MIQQFGETGSFILNLMREYLNCFPKKLTNREFKIDNL